MKVWHAVELEILRVAEQTVSAHLWIAGTNGIEFSDGEPDKLVLRAYFDSLQDENALRDQLVAALRAAGIASTALRSMKALTVADEDWLSEWKKGYSPVAIGKRLLVAPSWRIDEIADPDRVVVQIDPGMAFGTGTHETTRGCLEMLDTHWKGGTLLDVGTGTGILAIAAMKLAPDSSRIVGFDIDPEAIEVAIENAAINGVGEGVVFEVNNLAAYEGQDFDAATANLTAGVLITLAPIFRGVVRPQGILIASGILVEQSDDVQKVFQLQGFRTVEEKIDGEWITLRMEFVNS
jgi:ribosomal protein L11 methyltransferase